MLKLEKDIEEIKDKVNKICYILGITAVPPAKVIELKHKAAEIAEGLRNGNKKKNG